MHRPGASPLRIILAGLTMAALGGGVWWYLASRDTSTTTFRFAAVERGDLVSTVSATGALSAVKTVLVGTQVSGQVAEIHADFNDHVKKGQLLARLDPTLQKQAVQDAQANVTKAQAQLTQAQVEYDRNKPLFEAKFITGVEFGTVQVNRAVAIAGLQSAQVALDKARQNLALTNIYAPINGVVVERSVDVGQTVAASLSSPQLFLLAQDLAEMQILAAVDESDIGAIKEGQVANFTVQSYPGRIFTGAVAQVRLQSKTTDNVVSYMVVVRLANPEQKLLPGMTATVAFVTGSATNALLVQNAALRFKPTAAMLAAAGLTGAMAADSARRAARLGDSSARTVPAAPVAGGLPSGGPGGGPPAATTRRPASRVGAIGSMGTVWMLDSAKVLKRVRVRIGLSDGQRTQVTTDSLQAGMSLIVGATTTGATTAAASTAPAANPLTPQPQRRGPP